MNDKPGNEIFLKSTLMSDFKINFFVLLNIFIPFVFPASFMLPYFLIVISIIILMNKSINTDLALLLITMCFVLFSWSYIGIGLFLYSYGDLETLISVRAFSLVVVLIILNRFFSGIIFYDTKILILIALVLISFFKSEDKIVAIKYIANVYFPLIVSLHFYRYFLERFRPKVDPNKIKFCSVKFILSIIILVNLFFVVIHLLGLINIQGFFSPVGEALRGGAAGNFRTVIANINIERIPGIFADPIVAGYFLAICFFFFVFTVKKKKIKVFMLLVIFLMILISFSKASYLLLILGVIGYKIYSFRINQYSKIGALIFLYATTLFIAIYRALQDGITDSSAVHVLGLIMPFSQKIDFNYFFGNDLGSGGNMGGWVEQGAESFIGLAMYNIGALGVLIIMIISFRLICLSFKRSDLIGKFFVTALFPVILVSFLQENSFNLAYSVPRIIVLIFIVMYSKVDRSPNNLECI